MTGSDHQPDEMRALSRLAFEELGGAAAGIWSVHRAIAERAFRATGPGARPVHRVHDAIAGGVYATVGGTAGLVGRAAEVVLEGRRRSAARQLSTTPAGAALVAVVNGLIGDALKEKDSELHQPMAVRVDGRVVAAEPAALAQAFPAATSRLVVFLHGLMETEFAWRLRAGENGGTYGTRLAHDLGCTPVYVRYNSGLHISENGRSLADLLAALDAAWPVEVGQIALVGHSMGGLVARSACYHAGERRDRWVRRVRHVVSLGTPHMGAPLEQMVHVGSAVLDAFPETRPFGTFLRRRSGGIRDLRQGSLVDEDWSGRDPDALRAAACREVPLLDCATHCFVAATVTREPTHPVGRLIGDWLVLQASASGRSRTRRIPFRAEHGLHVGSTNHLALLNHPAVYERLREWLATAPDETTSDSRADASSASRSKRSA